MRPDEMGPLWCDSRSAIISARKEQVADISRKSRHMAIRLSKVRDERERLAFCPTNLQRADGLTKGSPSASVYDLLFTVEGAKWKQKEKEDDNAKPVPDLEAYAVSVDSGARVRLIGCHLALFCDVV